MLGDINLQNPTVRRMIFLQLGITAGFAIIAGIVSGEHAAVSAILGGLTNVFASVIFVFVANVGLRTANRLGQTGMWPLLRAELVKLVFIAIQLGLIIKLYEKVSVTALFTTFLVTLLAWRVMLLTSGNGNNKQLN
jgi:ATP synthase protein I